MNTASKYKRLISIVVVVAICVTFVFSVSSGVAAETFNVTASYYANMRYSMSSHAWQAISGISTLVVPVNFYSNTRHVVSLSGLTYASSFYVYGGPEVNYFTTSLNGYTVNDLGDTITFPLNVGDSSIKFVTINVNTPTSFDGVHVQIDGVDCKLVSSVSGISAGAISNNGFYGFTTDIKVLDNLSVNGLDYISRFEKFTDTSSTLSYVLDFTEDIPATYLDMVVKVNNGSISEASIGSWTDTQGWIGLTVDSITRDINSTGYCSYYRIYGEVESGFSTKECHLQFDGSFNDSDLQIISMNLFNDSIAPFPFNVNGFVTFNGVDYSSSGSNMGWNLAGINPAEDFTFVLKANERWKEMDYLIFDFTATCTSLDSLFVYMDNGSGGISLLPFENRLVSGFSAADGSTNKVFRVIVDLTNVNRTIDSDIVLSLGGKIYEGGLSFQLINSYGYVVSSPTAPELSWLRKIWNSISDGFTNVINVLSNGFKSVVNAIENMIAGGEDGQEFVDKAEEQAGKIDSAVGELDKVEKPKLDDNFGDISVIIPAEETLAFNNILAGVLGNSFVVQILMLLVLFMTAGYVLFGKKG